MIWLFVNVGSVDVFGSHRGAHFKKAKREPNAMIIDGIAGPVLLAGHENWNDDGDICM